MCREEDVLQRQRQVQIQEQHHQEEESQIIDVAFLTEEQMAQEMAVPLHHEPVLAEQNRADKHQKTPEQLEVLAQKEKEKRLKAAIRKDRARERNDKIRHGFYKFVGAFVKAGRRISGADREARNTDGDHVYQMSLMEARDHLYALRLDAEDRGELAEFQEKYGAELTRLDAAYAEAEQTAEQVYENEEHRMRHMMQVQVDMPFAQVQKANVSGGTKPVATRYTGDGAKWLMKEGLSCINAADPAAPITTEIGYQMQRLVHPDTAIEAFRGKCVGKGVVSYQRMVSNLAKNDVDLFRFSRTPEALTPEELDRVQTLAPQILREHTTDWLLCNYDTKGENFIITHEEGLRDRVYGIDKEASFRAIMDEGAQHMSKDYQRFDQDTVYNQLFRKFADGSMDFDLSVIEEQILRVEQLDKTEDGQFNEVQGDARYIGMFEDYIRLQQSQKGEAHAQEVEKRILRRKQNLRHEYREFLGSLVQERIRNKPEEADYLTQKYLGGEAGGMFLFVSDTREILQRERAKVRAQQMENREEMERKVKKAETSDERKYKARHAVYDFSKGVIMGLKKARDFVKYLFQTRPEEQRTIRIRLDEVKQTPGADNTLLEEVERRRAEWGDLTEEQIAERMHTETIDLRMVRDESIQLGGTKPMSQYIGADGSKWLAKQAVNCMGGYKIEGALLTEAGANLQKALHPETAVEAFVGRTKKHGEVSFQRRLEHVESREDEGGKLDLFMFSKHPELADDATLGAVQALSPQILREHVTDWLLCNFDTKGENFIITRDEEGQRVLHGIDKEAAFNNILKPEAQHMSRTYKPHANNTLYNVIYSMYAENKMDMDLNGVLGQIRKVEAMSDAEYMGLFRQYTDHVAVKKPKQIQEIRDKILRRKKELRQDYENFFTELINERCKHLHPEEAAELRGRYFVHGRFHFGEENPA